MRKLISILLLLCLMPCIGIAEDFCPSPVPSPDTEEIEIFDNSKFGFMALIKPFSDNIVYATPVVLNTKSRHLTYSILMEQVEGDCFLIDADCNLIGNVSTTYTICETCSASWCKVDIILAPNKYEANQIVYLVWVAD